MTYAMPLPVPDPESRLFWEGCREGRLMLQRCRSTGKFQFPPTTFCPDAGLERPEWVEASGRGRIFSWIVVRHPVPKDIYADKVPYMVALILLDEGCRMVSNIEDCAPEDVYADMPVKATFRRVTPEITLPIFVPAKA